MKGINKTLFSWAVESNLIKKLGWLNRDSMSELKKALGDNETERFDSTINLLSLIWSKYPELGLPPSLFLLGNVEIRQTFYENYRDHSTHPFKVYLLGLHFYENNDNIHNLFSDEDKFIRTWTLASLWHDMGYLYDSKGNLLSAISENINEQLSRLLSSVVSSNCGFDANVEKRFYSESKIKPAALDAISDIDKDTALFELLNFAGIASGLTPSEGNPIQKVYSVIETCDSYDKTPKHKDHGIVSALMLVKIWSCFDEILNEVVKFINSTSSSHRAINLIASAISAIKDIQKCMINLGMKKIVEEAAQAIALHNINKDSINNTELLSNGINIKQFRIAKETRDGYIAQPFAYLLKLVDELQDWDRQKYVRQEGGNSVSNGDDMNIHVTSSFIGLWFREDEKYVDAEYADSMFSRTKIKLANYIDVDLVLKGLKATQIPAIKEKIDESKEEFCTVFYNDVAKDLLEHIKRTYNCDNVSVLLFDRLNSTFNSLNPYGEMIKFENKTLAFAKDKYFKNDSAFYAMENGKTKGFALITTHVGSLGFLLLEDIDEDNKLRELTKHHFDIAVLGDYGLMYGAIVFRNIQRLIQKKVLISTSFEQDELITQINNFIPFGYNRCISVFLDIRGLSNLFADNQEQDIQRSLQFIHEFSEIVEDISAEHYGIITSHFGGGMFITFNQVLREELEMSCYRAVCTMHKIRKAFYKELLPLAKKLFGDEIADQIDIGMGASAGDAVFLTLGINPCIFYTGMGKDIGFSKKIENISGRNTIHIDDDLKTQISKGQIFISDEVYHYFCRRQHVEMKPIKNEVCVSHSTTPQKLYHICDTDINRSNCPLRHKCNCCKENK